MFLNAARDYIKGDGLFRKVLRSLTKTLLKTVYGKRGVRINLGGRYNIRIGIDFIKYENFGDRHNKNWLQCLEYCRGKKSFFDIGAHIGLYSIPASMELGSTGRVYAFEPSIRNYTALNHHIAINTIKNISTYNYLVGDFDANALFYEDARESNPMNSIVMTEKMSKNKDRYKRIYRKQISLDNFCCSEKIKPEVIKIDTEGAEPLVLKGAQTVLRKYHPIIFLSLHPNRMALLGYSTTELVSLIVSLGYEMCDIDHASPEDLPFGDYILKKKD